MSAFEEDVLWDCLIKSMAWRDLHDPKIGGTMNSDEILELGKQAGLSEKDAQRLATQRGWERVKRDLPP